MVTNITIIEFELMKSFTFLPKIIINFKIILCDITAHYDDDDDDDDRIIFRIFFVSIHIFKWKYGSARKKIQYCSI